MSALTALGLVRQEILKLPDIDFSTAMNRVKNPTTDFKYLDYDNARYLNTIIPKEIIEFENPNVLRNALKNILLALEPDYLYVFPTGRNAVRQLLSVNEYQVFRNADLFVEYPDAEVIAWWDELSNLIRNNLNTEDFREAEKKSYEIELELLSSNECPFTPKWIALDDNTAGYDILSYRIVGDSWVPIAIEVKSTSSNHVRFYLTRNEARITSQMKERYFLHFWKASEPNPVVFQYQQIMSNLPIDVANGKWQSVLIEI